MAKCKQMMAQYEQSSAESVASYIICEKQLHLLAEFTSFICLLKLTADSHDFLSKEKGFRRGLRNLPKAEKQKEKIRKNESTKKLQFCVSILAPAHVCPALSLFQYLFLPIFLYFTFVFLIWRITSKPEALTASATFTKLLQ